GVNVLTQAGVCYALSMDDSAIEKRRDMVIEQRRRLMDELHDLPVDAPESQANFVWLHAAGLNGAQLAARLEEKRVLVAPGAPLGADDCVRASIWYSGATGRLLSALAEAVEQQPV
ncbi:MAG TPA: aminotransferase class I/II-fold pyridoxal phosphate-dependent enzyme, partial [Thermoleophilaceae bacterium]|nr:aminotransferase class I/II-fold pyridoxal phosphate-dependent enzyme [Thermoleophilaceae bacterium]